MFAAWGVIAAACVAAAQYDSVAELDVPAAELDAFDELQDSVWRPHRHLRHSGHRRHESPRHKMALAHHKMRVHHWRPHRHHKMALTHHHSQYVSLDPDSAAPRLNWNPNDEEDRVPLQVTPMALPGRHPSVEKALDGMGGELQDLKVKQLTAKQTRGELEGKVSEAVRHMNDAMAIKHAISKKEAQLRVAQSKLESLEREASHIDGTHASLVSSLHRVLEPKLESARMRLEKKEILLKRETEATSGWKQKKEQIHEHALEFLKEKKMAQQSLLEAEKQVALAKKEEEVAQKRYDDERKRTAQEVQSFRYAETREKAEITHEKAAEEAARDARESVKKLSKVLEVEAEKVEESMQVHKTRIRQRMQEIEAEREKTRHELVNLQQQYREWQDMQRQRAAEVVRKAQDTAMTAEAYADQQKHVLDSAQQKVAQDAEGKSDWAWESGFSNDAGFTDSNPSLSD